MLLLVAAPLLMELDASWLDKSCARLRDLITRPGVSQRLEKLEPSCKSSTLRVLAARWPCGLRHVKLALRYSPSTTLVHRILSRHSATLETLSLRPNLDIESDYAGKPDGKAPQASSDPGAAKHGVKRGGKYTLRQSSHDVDRTAAARSPQLTPLVLPKLRQLRLVGDSQRLLAAGLVMPQLRQLSVTAHLADAYAFQWPTTTLSLVVTDKSRCSLPYHPHPLLLRTRRWPRRRQLPQLWRSRAALPRGRHVLRWARHACVAQQRAGFTAVGESIYLFTCTRYLFSLSFFLI